MNSETHRDRSAPRSGPGFARKLLTAFLQGADEALHESRRVERDREGEHEQCRLRPEHSRLTRGYREI
ncbi:MAG: hypothetical protein OXH15_00485 [Gammaproteobacteria bacterium]|nr:hypothetical protein [Gammaproteobacteria bacterium]